MDLICPLFCILIVIIPILILVVAANAAAEAKKRLAAAKLAYENSLAELRNLPTSPELRIQTLELGRIYSNLTRGQQGVAIFDEIALKNDIDAACASAVNVVRSNEPETLPIPTSFRDEIECPYCAELILRKAKICKHCSQPIGNSPDRSDSAIAPVSPPIKEIEHTCSCGKTLRIKPDNIGKRARCPSCKTVFRVPG